MPIDFKEVAGFTGIEAEDFDTFKEAFNEKFVPKEQHSKTLGELNGKALHELTKTAKELGVEVDDIKGKQLLEAVPVLREKLKGRLAEIEGQKSASAEEIEAKYKADLDKWKQKATDYTQLLETTKSEYEGFKSQVETDKRQFQINTHFDKSLGGLKFSESANEFTRKGFVSTVREKYAFDLSDEGSPVVRGKDGNIIQSKVKAGTPATFDEVLSLELKEAKLEAVVDSKKVPTFVAPAGKVGQPQGGRETPRRFQPKYAR
jgi:hypothetical protein